MNTKAMTSEERLKLNLILSNINRKLDEIHVKKCKLNHADFQGISDSLTTASWMLSNVLKSNVAP